MRPQDPTTQTNTPDIATSNNNDMLICTSVQTIGQKPSGYTVYRVDADGTISDVVANLSSTCDEAEWEEIAKLNGARPVPSILRSLQTAYRIVPTYENVTP